MRKIPLWIQGLFFAPILICLFFVLKATCPESAGSSCFADQFAVPIFLPLVAIFKIFGSTDFLMGQEFLFILIYWALIGALIGLILDLCIRRSRYLPEPHLPPSQTSVPESLPPSQA